MAPRDDLESLIDDLSVDDPGLRRRVDDATARRELALDLAACRREANLTQTQVAQRMGTSQGQVARFESGADTRMSTVARYAAAVGMKVSWSIEPLRPRRRAARAKSA